MKKINSEFELKDIMKNKDEKINKVLSKYILFDKKKKTYEFSKKNELKKFWGVIGKEILVEKNFFYKLQENNFTTLTVDISSNSVYDTNKTTNMRKKYLSNLLKPEDLYMTKSDILNIIDIGGLNGDREKVDRKTLLQISKFIMKLKEEKKYEKVIISIIDEKYKWYKSLTDLIKFDKKIYLDFLPEKNEIFYDIDDKKIFIPVKSNFWKKNNQEKNKQLRRMANYFTNIFLLNSHLLDPQICSLTKEQVKLSEVLVEKKVIQHYSFVKTNYVIFSKIFRIEENWIMYESFFGQKNDSPEKIFEYIQNRYNDKYLHFFVIKKQEKSIVSKGKNVFFLKYQSLAYSYFLAKSKFLINNVTFPDYFIKKEKQVYLNTWHGISMKTLGKGIKNNYGKDANTTRNFLQADYVITPNDFSKKTFLDDYNISTSSLKFITLGYPRNDSLIKSKKNKVKTILYAPTWRGYTVEKKILEFVKKFEKQNKYELVIKLHHFDAEKFKNVKKTKNIHFSSADSDINTLMLEADLLISDYSSIIFDYALLEKPILLYTYDLKKYKSERGLVEDIKNFGLIYVENLDELMEKLEVKEINVGPTHKIFNYTQNKKFNNAELISKILLEDCSLNTKTISNDNKKILIYGGAMLKNGITTSLVNWVNTLVQKEYDIYIFSRSNNLEKKVFERISPKCNYIFRKGAYNLMPSEFENYQKFIDCEKLDYFDEIHKREISRTFGSAAFDFVIDFNGYAPFFSNLLLNIESKKKYIFQHNDMKKEYEKIKNGKKIHKENLTIVFNMYKKFDKVIGVSKTTAKNNQKNLSEFYDIDKRYSVENFINFNEILERVKEVSNNEFIKISSHITNSQNSDILEELYYKKTLNVLRTKLPDNLIFVSIGRLESEKENIKMLKYFKMLSDKFANVYYYIIGEGTQKENIENYIYDNNMTNQVKLLGYVENPYPILKIADALIILSSSEGQPMVILESLVLDKKVIVSEIPGTMDYLNYNFVESSERLKTAEDIVQFVTKKEINQFNALDYNGKIMKKYIELLD